MERAFFGTYTGRPAGIRFRPIVEADQSFLMDLYASTRETELAPVAWPPEAKRTFLEQQFTAQHAYYHQVFQDADFLLIQRDEVSIGRIYVHRVPGKIHLADITLQAQHRGHGIGTALLAELIDEARANSCEINLYVEPGNPVQRLYARLGFQFVERCGAYDYLVLPPAG